MKYVFLLLALSLVSCNEASQKTTATQQIDTNDSKITLEIHDFGGVEKYLNVKDDKVYVVNFWATWCAPCVKELPYFEQLGANYKSDRVEVILVSLDFPRHYDSKLKPFLAENNLQSKIVVLNDVDCNSWIPKVDENWSGAIPATLIYSKNKRQFYEQSFNYNELETELKHFLK